MNEVNPEKPSGMQHTPESNAIKEAQSPPSPPASASGSDNESSERSAREKLKKASLASLAKDDDQIATKNPANIEEGEYVFNQPARINTAVKSSTAEKSEGRPQRKRSFDDLEDRGREFEPLDNDKGHGSGAHARKRSRDARLGEHIHKGPNSLASPSAPVQEEPEEGRNESSLQSATLGSTAASNDVLQETMSPALDEERRSINRTSPREARPDLQEQEADQRSIDRPDMEDGAYSPRKKRSRDQLDTEVDREQKIPATEEARAQRLSSEADRPAVGAPGHSDSSPPDKLEIEDETKQDPPKSVFGSISRLATDATNFQTVSPEKSFQHRATAPSAFAASGFAALAKSSASPFGGHVSAPLTSQSPFAQETSKGPTNSDQSPRAAAVRLDAGSGTAQKTVADAGSPKAVPSPFAGLAAAKPSVFGGSVFGQSYSSGFGTGSKLTSFAAPNGDANLSASNGNIKPIGSPNHQGEDTVLSNSDGEGDDDTEKDDTAKEAEDTSHDQQDGEAGEEVKITSRASLFAFRNNTWKESGKGVFKFNVAEPDVEEGSLKTGRFIMRAHQTYRVMLNAPVFKQMKVGDSKGKEPPGKSFLFAVIEDCKPTPYMIKLGDAKESKRLYDAVQQFQQELD